VTGETRLIKREAYPALSPFGGGWREATGEDLGGWGAGRAGYGLWEKTGDGEWWIVRVSRAGDRR
jgi:hypothetical protein